MKSTSAVIIVCALLFLISSCAVHPSREQSSTSQADNRDTSELRGVWISYIELGNMFKSGGFKTEFNSAMDKCVSMGINTVFVHVRANADAFYRSEYYPWSEKISGTQGVAPDYDPLEFMIESAHSRCLSFHAWINPYRVSNTSNDYTALAATNPARKWMSDGEHSDRVYKTDSGLYFDPANRAVNNLVLDGVREIVKKYDVDGIHFDDYFYPTTSKKIDQTEYAAYLQTVTGEPLSLADWRRAVINNMVSAVCGAVKSIDKTCVFGISPAANEGYNYSSMYADTEAWIDGGYIDYIMPQIYFGFEYPVKKYNFTSYFSRWSAQTRGSRVALYIGLGAYRIGTREENTDEWRDKGDVLARQVKYIRDSKAAHGFVFFSYSYLFSGKADKERDSLKKLLV